MRKFVLILTLLLLATKMSLMAYVNALPECCSYSWWPAHKLSFYGAAGWREDDINWSVRNPKFFFPKVISKLKWKNLRMVQISGGVRYVCRNYVARLKGEFAWTYHGKNRDLDFLDLGEGDDILISKSKNESNRGWVYEISPGVGYQLTSNGGRCIVTPMGGWSFHSQELRITDGHQKFNKFNPLAVGRFKKLNSTYVTRWFGGWLGADFETKVECNAWFFGGFEYHWMRYRAIGHWNLRKDMRDFRHFANAQGYIAHLGFSWECIPNLTFGFMGDYKFFRTTVGDEKISFKKSKDDDLDGSKKRRRAVGTLERLHWHSISASAVIGYRF